MTRFRLTISLILCLGARIAIAGGPGQFGELQDRAVERAVSYDGGALDWICDEAVRLAKYDGNGEASRESERHFALLMGREDAGQAPVELRGARSSTGAASAQRPARMTGFPPVTSWLRLFHPEIAGFVVFQDRGEDTTAVVARHAVAFRGALPYTHGDDFREWEGTAWLDPATGDLLEVEASPSSQRERLLRLLDQRNRRAFDVVLFRVLGFRIGPTALGHRVQVSFGPQNGGFWLPIVARLETFEAVSTTKTSPWTVVVNSINRCRRFETDAVPGVARLEPR